MNNNHHHHHHHQAPPHHHHRHNPNGHNNNNNMNVPRQRQRQQQHVGGAAADSDFFHQYQQRQQQQQQQQPPPKVDPSMTLTVEELQRAREIKAAVEACDEIDSTPTTTTAQTSASGAGTSGNIDISTSNPLSMMNYFHNPNPYLFTDYDYAQWAIVSLQQQRQQQQQAQVQQQQQAQQHAPAQHRQRAQAQAPAEHQPQQQPRPPPQENNNNNNNNNHRSNNHVMNTVLERMYKLQQFKKEYRIHDTMEEGLQLIHQLMMLFPGYILSVDFAPRYGSYILVQDYAAFFPDRVLHNNDSDQPNHSNHNHHHQRQQQSHYHPKHKLRILLGGLYYIYQCLSTNLRAVRSGVVFITECDNMDERRNFNTIIEEMKLHHLFLYYPFHYKECLWLNTPTIANVMYGTYKSQMPYGFNSTWRLGCKLDGYEGRIDALFKMPTMEIAQEQLLSRIEHFLMERYEQNGKHFTLSC